MRMPNVGPGKQQAIAAPTVTLVTPSFNQVVYLRDTLRSVMAQREQIFEYFVCDGGSTDGSKELIERHAHAIDHFHSGPDGGQSAALQRAFAHASGDVFGWINSDDLLLPGAIAAVRQAFAADPRLDVVMGWLAFVDAGTRVVRMHRNIRAMPWLMRLGVTYLNQPAMFFRRSAYEAVGGLDPSLSCMMDADLWYRLVRANVRFGELRQYLAAFRRHGDQKWMTLSKRYKDEGRLLAQRYPEFHSDKQTFIGETTYRVLQVASLNHAGGYVETLRHRGKHIDHVFPPTHRSGA